MKNNATFLHLFFLVCTSFFAQNKPTNQLDEVLVSDTKLQKFSSSQTILALNDSILAHNQPLLTDLLQNNSVIYFKQYGRGMLSSVSFRGTTASQTAVLWNGININSQMNGQTDFNTISSQGYNSIAVKGGGGSVLYGSGAIGGTVHLNDYLVFDSKWAHILQLDYGSFNTQGIRFNTHYATKKLSTQLGFTRNYSDNDYKYPNTFDWKGNQRYNLNGRYSLNTLNASLGYKFNDFSILKFYSQYSITDRNLVVQSEAETKPKYINAFSRNLIDFSTASNQWNFNFKTAFITENYRYYADIEKEGYSFGETASVISKADISYHFKPSLVMHSLFDFTHTKGYGSGFGTHLRDIGSVALLLKHEVTKKWQNEFGIRQEITNNYQSPLLFSVGTAYTFTPFYSLKINGSRNFRIPTYNDLYWEPGGNRDLKPEQSYQAELANVFTFKRWHFSQTTYFATIQDLLQWIPGDKGIWSPRNTDKAQTYGIEYLVGYKQPIGKNIFTANATYAYTISRDLVTNKQLFYVPFHKTTASVGYNIGRFSAAYQLLYNGLVYTRSDNDPNFTIPSYAVSNISADYDFKLLKSFKLGVQVLNLANKKYQGLENVIMPGRSFNMYIILKF